MGTEGENLADVFMSRAAQQPDATAVVCADVRLTYGELAERVHRTSRLLAEAGVGPGHRVGVLLRNDHQHVEVLLACFALRAVPVNLNVRYVARELAEVLGDCGARVVVHEPARADALPSGVTSIPVDAAYEAALAVHDRSPLDVQGRSGDDRYVLLTGGTTDRPRAVVWRHRDLLAAALTTDDLELAGRRVLVAAPLFHGTGQWMALRTLLGGGTLIFVATGEVYALRVWDVAEAEGATHLVVVGNAFVRPLVLALDEEPDRWRLDRLAVVLSGGAPLTPSLALRLVGHLPTAMVVDGYGASETGGHARAVTVAGSAPTPAPVFTVDDDTAILDDDLRPRPMHDDREGWLARRGPLPLGYDGDADLNARTFPMVDGERWALPGDRARWAGDHRVVILGRGDLTVNTGGEKVHVEEVENVLRAHEAVADAVVVGTPDERWGEVVTAVVEPAGDHAPTLDELADHCRAHLAAFKVPRRLVVVAAVRRTPTGKPDYRWARSTVG